MRMDSERLRGDQDGLSAMELLHPKVREVAVKNDVLKPSALDGKEGSGKAKILGAPLEGEA